MTAPAVARRWAPETEDYFRVLAPAAVRLRRAVRRAAPAGAAVLTVLVAQVAVASHLVVWGAGPDVVAAAVVAVAARRGSSAGATFGFCAGLGADLFLPTPLGTTALAYTVVGHGLGRARRPRALSGTAAALCNPASTCFSCRSGRRHSGPVAVGRESAGDVRARPDRVRRRATARRLALRRALVLTALGVAAARVAAMAVATALGGVPFAGPAALIRVVATALLSAPLGVPLLAASRRFAARFGRNGEAP